jgi:hypothetical protein
MDYIYYLQQMLQSSDDWVIGPYCIGSEKYIVTLRDSNGIDIACIY